MIITEETYRARRHIAFYAFVAPLLMAALINVSDRSQQVQLGIVTAIAALMALILYVVLGAVQVRFNQHSITYTTILKSRELTWANLRSVYVKKKHTGKSSHRFLVFENTAGKQVIEINIALFSRRSLQAICSAACGLAPRAALDERASGFANGEFPWYIR
ncbi:MAG: hypothetical protein EOO08_13255 [Chitinophagaceae bacterium]|nr:MAG: hypothetical protein EOO08_13255 [Chitinophagaceae bacterium]